MEKFYYSGTFLFVQEYKDYNLNLYVLLTFTHQLDGLCVNIYLDLDKQNMLLLPLYNHDSNIRPLKNSEQYQL